MHDAELRAAFERLEDWLKLQGCAVKFSAPLVPWEHDVAGTFLVRQNRGRITVYRVGGQYVAGPADEELVTLSHEGGHWRSWRRGERPEEPYLTNCMSVETWPALSDAEKRTIFDEEVRAWTYGAELLREAVPSLPPSFWATLCDRRDAALANYRIKLDWADK